VRLDELSPSAAPKSVELSGDKALKSVELSDSEPRPVELSEGRPKSAGLGRFAPGLRGVCAYTAMERDGNDVEMFGKARLVELSTRIATKNNIVPRRIKIPCENNI
jgi:hypothetical protein